MLTTVEVVAYPRLHMTLIDLAGTTYRTYGGVGFFADKPRTVVRSSPHDKFELRAGGIVDATVLADVEAHLSAIKASLPAAGAQIEIVQMPPSHCGFGSKTSLLMATLSAIFKMVGLKVPPRELVELSGRGGTSGVGINGFFTGGFVFDGGHQRAAAASFLPSRARLRFRPPPLTARLPAPEAWSLILLHVPGKRLEGQQEVEFFERNTPIPVGEVHEVLALVYHGVLPAVAEANHELLALAVKGIQKTGFKKREIENQGDDVRAALEHLNSTPRVAAGLSSLGPLIYIILADTDPALVAETLGISRIYGNPSGPIPFCNSGATARTV